MRELLWAPCARACTAWFLDRLSASGVTAAAHAIWSDCCGGGTLHIPVTRSSGSDAYTVTPTPGNGSTGPVDPTVVVDGTDTDTADLDHFGYGANWGVTNGVADMCQQTANWSYTGGAVATFTFRGTRVALHAVRDTDQGVMSLSLDGGSPVTVDNYAPSRNASGVVWTSPQVGAGQHTLTVTNTGQRNAASGGTNIALDRADVTPS